MNEKTLRILEFNKIIEMLLTHAASKLGMKKIKDIQIYKDRELIQLKQRETSEAVDIIIREESISFSGIYDIKGSLKKAKIGSILTLDELLKTADTLRGGRIVYNSIKRIQEKYSIIPSISRDIVVIKAVEDRIFECIVNQEEINDHATSELYSIRKKIRKNNEGIRNKLNSIVMSQENRKILQDPIVTIRNGRFVVPVKQECRGSFKGVVHDQSASGATLFIEPMVAVELNNELSRLKAQEEREIERILAELTQLVSENSSDIWNNIEILAELDFIFARAGLSLELNGVSPIINDNRYINLVQARHPLIPKDDVVPVDVYLGLDFNVLVITGPNTGGKTVSLKTAGLLVLMAQAGLHVSAKHGTEIGVFKHIYADIGDEQSIEQSLSTFSSHMSNIAGIIKEVDDQSLVLLDELGAGTDPTEGAALAISILNYMIQKNVRTIATTHYSELKEFALSQQGIENGSVEFDIQTLSPTYRLIIGVPGRSNAFEISRRLGLSDTIIEDAKQHITGEKTHFEDIVSKLEDNRKAAQNEREIAERDRIQADSFRKEYRQKLDNIENLKKRILQQAKEEAKKLIAQTKKDMEEMIKELRELRNTVDTKNINKDIERIRTDLHKEISKIDDELYDGTNIQSVTPPDNLKKGETVLITNLNQTGIVLSEPDANGDLQAQVGIMKVKTNVKTLIRVDVQKEHNKGFTSMLKLNKEKRVFNEISVRGKTLEEAILNTDKFLDDAYLAGLLEVVIIHGKGAGILRNGLHELLRKHPQVKEFRIGRYGEGERGVTVVQLKERL